MEILIVFMKIVLIVMFAIVVTKSISFLRDKFKK